MKIDRFPDGREYRTAETADDLIGWDCKFRLPYKEGVDMIHATRRTDQGMEMRIIWCSIEIPSPA